MQFLSFEKYFAFNNFHKNSNHYYYEYDRGCTAICQLFVRAWENWSNSSAQDFALAAKSVRMHKFSQRIQPFANSKL
ncbi:hypothetical protein D3Z44_05300 [Lachnospiraceae bacterium]|nr:hypothetical protein [Lachnospiraceae bacterium]